MSHRVRLSPQGTPEFTWGAPESVLSVKPLQAVVMNNGRAIRKIKDFPKTGKAIVLKLLQLILVKVTGFLLYGNVHLPTVYI